VGATLAEVLRTFGPTYLREHALSTAQARAWRAIVACRTPALGGKLQQCDQCGRQQRLFYSCRNRHCPQCQSDARDAWRQAQLAELLAVAKKCPVHKLMTTVTTEITTEMERMP